MSKKRAAPQARGKPRSGGGLTVNKLRQVGVKAGPARTDVVSVEAVSDLGMRTAYARPDLFKRTAEQVRSGNDVAASTVRGPGGSRTIYKSGYQDLHGKASPGEGRIGPNAGRDILSDFGPEKKVG
jgi:hypothetical protein